MADTLFNLHKSRGVAREPVKIVISLPAAVCEPKNY